MTEAFAASPLARAIGFALLQFLWQGVAIWALTALALATLRRATPQARYAAGCLALTVMVAAPAITTAEYLRNDGAAAVNRTITSVVFEPAATAGVVPVTTPALSSPIFSSAWLDARLPLVMLIWSAGVLLLGLHLVYGWARVRQIQRSATPVASHATQDVLKRLTQQLGVARPLRLVQSALVEVPSVIGFVRPAIILPVSALANLPPAHLEAILAHELAHIRRGDYFVNFLQCSVEVLLFYHPAVWWVSKQIRREREHCCDDIAAALSDRVEYAHALVSLESLRADIPALAIGATGGELLGRVRRLVDPATAAPRSSGWAALTAVATVLAIVAIGQIHGSAATTQAAARVTGTVVDPQGGVVPGVSITIRRGDIDESAGGAADVRSAVSDAAGRFAFTDLAAGPYLLTASMPAFKTARFTVQVAPNESVNGTVRLALGSLSEQITVRGDFTAPPAAAAADSPANPATADPLRTGGETGTFTPSPEPSAGGPIRVGGSIKEPKKIKDVKPDYPEIAQNAGVTGVVILDAVIDRDGYVEDVRVLRSVALLDDAAMSAVRQWRFTPTLLNGQPVAVLMTVTVNFIGRD
jgi:bla regulator protein blaR1